MELTQPETQELFDILDFLYDRGELSDEGEALYARVCKEMGFEPPDLTGDDEDDVGANPLEFNLQRLTDIVKDGSDLVGNRPKSPFENLT